MANIVGVKFSGNAKIYSFDSSNLELAVGDGVIVETVKGLEYGTVAEAVRASAQEDANNPFKPVLRKATDKDVERVRRGLEQKPHALEVANGKIAERNLPMKLVDCEYAFDGSKLTFYFTSDSRVDFRDLVRDLASFFHMRIELRQIGIRDECKMLGGIAPCGRPCCCSAFLNDFTHVTVKMAKNQGLSLNPTKISGLCGRLMCCLEYENDHYVETGRRMPRIGSEVETPDGVGVVWSDNMLKEQVRVRVPVKDGFEVRDYKLADIGFEKAAIGSGSQKFTQRQEEDKDDLFEFGEDSITTQEIISEQVFGETGAGEETERPAREERPRREQPAREHNRTAENGGEFGRDRNSGDRNRQSGNPNNNDRNRQGGNTSGNDRNRQGGNASGNDRNRSGERRDNPNNRNAGNRNHDNRNERNANAQNRPDGTQGGERPSGGNRPDRQNNRTDRQREPRPAGGPREGSRNPNDRSAPPNQSNGGNRPRGDRDPRPRHRPGSDNRPTGGEPRPERAPDAES